MLPLPSTAGLVGIPQRLRITKSFVAAREEAKNAADETLLDVLGIDSHFHTGIERLDHLQAESAFSLSST